MTQEEPQVEGRVARVRAFEVEQDQASGVHQDVLRAEVAQDERSLVGGPIHGGDQGIDARGQVRMGTRGGAVVGIDPQLVEQARVGQGFAQGRMFRGPGVDRAQDRTQPRGDVRVDPASHQVGLPGDRVVRGAGHREEVIADDPRTRPSGPFLRAGSSGADRAWRARSRSGRAGRASPSPRASARGIA